MTLTLTRRLVKGAPLTAQDHDGNLDVLEAAIGTSGPGGGLVSASGTAPIQVANGTTAAVISIAAPSGTSAGSMSSADFTKLASVATGASVAHVSGLLPVVVTDPNTTPQISINPATTSLAGLMSAADKTKLDGVAPGATANLGTVTQVSGTGCIQSTGAPTPIISILAATTTIPGSMSAADKTKLNGIADSATANATDAALRARSSHTGTQLASTISDFTAATVAALKVDAHATTSYGSTVNWDLAVLSKELRSLTLAGNCTFVTTGHAIGQSTSIRIICDGTNRTLTFPAAWTFIGGAGRPTSISANKTGILSITVYGIADSAVVAAWAVQP